MGETLSYVTIISNTIRKLTSIENNFTFERRRFSRVRRLVRRGFLSLSCHFPRADLKWVTDSYYRDFHGQPCVGRAHLVMSRD